MPRVTVTVAPEAVAEVAVIATWWNENRPASPKLFQIELERALDLLADQPEIGHRIRAAGRPNLRVIVLRRSRYLVFYELDPESRDVIVTRVRHGRRRAPARPRRRRP